MSAEGGNRLRKGQVVAGLLDVGARETPHQTARDLGRPNTVAAPIAGRHALSLWDRMLEALDLELDAKLEGGDAGQDDIPESPPPVTPRPAATGKQGRHG